MTHEGVFRTNTVRFALTDDGVALPVIDVTSPAFALTAGEPEVAERCRLFVEESRARQNMSAEARAQMMQALRGSRLAQALTQASGGYLSGLATYLMKLGPDHLWPDAGEVDKRIAASFPAWTARLRLQDVARLLAEGLTPQLEREPTQPLILVNIAGGPASDAINALLVVRAASPNALAHRRTVIWVLDSDHVGSSFGKRSLAALCVPGAPLDGLDLQLHHEEYDWNETAVLEARMQQAVQTGHHFAVTSEGGLFEYGSDEAIVANLSVVRRHTGPQTIVVGSVTRNDGAAVEARGETNVATKPRSLGQFAALAAAGGWRVDEALEGPFSRQVRLVAIV